MNEYQQPGKVANVPDELGTFHGKDSDSKGIARFVKVKKKRIFDSDGMDKRRERKERNLPGRERRDPSAK